MLIIKSAADNGLALNLPNKIKRGRGIKDELIAVKQLKKFLEQLDESAQLDWEIVKKDGKFFMKLKCLIGGGDKNDKDKKAE